MRSCSFSFLEDITPLLKVHCESYVNITQEDESVFRLIFVPIYGIKKIIKMMSINILYQLKLKTICFLFLISITTCFKF
jgi:hypothetical protein